MVALRGRWLAGGFLTFFLTLLATPAAQAGKSDPAVELARRQAQEVAVRLELEGTVWSIQLSPMGKKSGKPVKDILTFENGKVQSGRLIKEGYPATNYTLTLQEGENAPTVWETMQTKEGAGVAFWRGERQGETLQGILSRRSDEGEVEDFSFSGSLKERRPVAEPLPASPAPDTTVQQPAESPEAVIPPTAQEVPSEQGSAQEQPREKKGWW